ncbi:hypothetical protein GGR32_000172 [Mesonia hippocampi]|uniref:Uncharacterized protein n=1 Tax=Mesonia hippocampi TaxID=1628250 RepID=A0A840ELN7_9FLAO|nr:hypothetical protein [Mesonia hippocampi]MBB4117900.1 hypothetical protein [Mesonia hippocampi]
MSKTKQKRQKYNDDVLQELKKKYDVTRNYIILSIRGERNGTLSIQIQEDYRKLNAASKKAINQKISEL